MSECSQTFKQAGSIIRERDLQFQVETNRNRKRTRDSFNTLDEYVLYAERLAATIKNAGTAAPVLRRTGSGTLYWPSASWAYMRTGPAADFGTGSWTVVPS